MPATTADFGAITQLYLASTWEPGPPIDTKRPSQVGFVAIDSTSDRDARTKFRALNKGPATWLWKRMDGAWRRIYPEPDRMKL